MGANGGLYVEDYALASFTNTVPALYCSLFQERERDAGEEFDVEEGGLSSYVIYETTAANALRRLALMGFSVDRCQRVFEQEREQSIAELDAWLKRTRRDSSSYRREQLRVRLRQLRKFRFDHWTKMLRRFLEEGTFGLSDFEFGPRDEDGPFSEVFDEDGDTSSFPDSLDIRIQWTGVLSTFDTEALVVLDVSELVESRRVDEDEEVVADGWRQLRGGIAENEPILVLTEGSSDAAILKMSLSALYPELEERFQFLDFDTPSYPGGAPTLVTLVKGFAGAGIRNRILGIVDNDAQGRDAVRLLKSITLPPSIKVITLPNLVLAQSYPTVGPLGKSIGDVNGLAVSIEFFAGEELLKSVGGGELDPVIWGSYVKSMKTYQGELGRKELVAKALRHSLSNELEPSAHKVRHPELRELWDHVFEVAESLS